MANINLDLGEAASPDQLPGILRQAAQRYLEDGGELDAAWQDKGAGRPWRMIARELERAADRIEKAL